MKKVSILYWSCGGNIELLANAMAEGARTNGAEVVLKQVADASLEDVLDADSVAFGSPAVDSTKIEQKEMKPFIEQLKTVDVKGKNCILFATYGWIKPDFMEIWKDEIKSYGFNFIGDLSIKDSPTKSQLQMIKKLGEGLAE